MCVCVRWPGNTHVVGTKMCLYDLRGLTVSMGTKARRQWLILQKGQIAWLMLELVSEINSSHYYAAFFNAAF